MFEVGVIGGTTQRQINNLCGAAEFYANELIPEQWIKDQLDITIEINHELDGCGECQTEDEMEYPREFTIYLNPSLDKKIYVTLAHEMVHLKQYAYGELYNTLALEHDMLYRAPIWKSKRWIASNGEDQDFDSPWEVEAYGREVGLYHKWKNRYATSR